MTRDERREGRVEEVKTNASSSLGDRKPDRVREDVQRVIRAPLAGYSEAEAKRLGVPGV